jgi:hypothetical protein
MAILTFLGGTVERFSTFIGLFKENFRPGFLFTEGFRRSDQGQ